MIIIRKTQTKKGTAFHVVTTAKNNEILKSSESLTSKQKCWGNILADIFNYPECVGVWVQDDSLTGRNQGLTIFCSIEVLKKKSGKK